MEGEGFLRRWSRLKSSDNAAPQAHVAKEQDPARRHPAEGSTLEAQPHPEYAGGTSPADSTSAQVASPTMEDAMRLTSESDYSAFVARHVDKDVRRAALKKLFAEPHFNQPDGLDIYMDDYNQAVPLSDPMLAALRQAQDFLHEQTPAEKVNEGLTQDKATQESSGQLAMDDGKLKETNASEGQS